ncbi:sensor histidine kinase [Rufibacter quisquiliarum]|uniref:histidine kinase n=1 Tax=Rufibacter quisquiliarum TaxID=1549639 RepID=A0A839GH90_9BACT|nr:HAMP domain-containing sensor histidine kinase [Rufibacter quisquiliarum]MBA9077940.1 signal transduction histidine kinase [Rufibacter quisquiliarum]
MRKKTLFVVIALMSLTLIGLIGFQAYWIHHAVKMEEELFDRNVNDALHQVARRLETKEAIHFLKQEAPQLREAALAPAVTTTETVVSTPTPAKSSRNKERSERKGKRNQPLPLAEPASSLSVAASGSAGSSVTMVTPLPGEKHTMVDRARSSVMSIRGGRSPHSESAQQIFIHSFTMSDSAAKPASVEVFGRSRVDSVVVRKLVAAQRKMLDTLRIYSRNGQAHFIRMDSGSVSKIALDSIFMANQARILRQIPVKSIKNIQIKGNVANIHTDCLFIGRSPEMVWRQDSSTRKGKRYVSPARVQTLAPLLLSAAPAQQQVAPTRPAASPRANTHSPVTAPTPEQVTEQKAVAKAQHLNQVMQQMVVEYVRKERPLEERLGELGMEEILATELKSRNIVTPYQSTLNIDPGNSKPTYLLASSNSLPSASLLPDGGYTVQLFPNDVLSAPSYLKLTFPHRQLIIWKSIWIPTVISVLFTLIIIFTFAYTLGTILRQKKISEIKNDFINNMTHEFKTPIATISLALDALVNPKVRKDEARLDHYARIIRDENKRMHQQVEKVLQTAQMERNKLQLAFEEVDVHALIQKAVEPFQLHIEQRQGNLNLKLDAPSPVVWADASHLANMVANLLDNANKYSPEAPRIVVQTTQVSKGLHISVEDQGAGMSREAQKKIFEKFYRVPTGNVHNVKGFGLGLSYVKTMAEAHGGNVHLRSELGKGSRFTLWLPLQKPSV